MKKLIVIILSIALLNTFSGLVYAGNNSQYGSPGSLSYTYIDSDSSHTLSWNDTLIVSATPPSNVTWAGDIQGSCFSNWISKSRPGTLIYSAYWFFDTTWTRTYILDSQNWADSTGAYCHFWGLFPDGLKMITFGDIYFAVNP